MNAPKSSDAEILNRFRRGHTQARIVSELRVEHRRVKRVIKSRGMTPHPSGRPPLPMTEHERRAMIYLDTFPRITTRQAAKMVGIGQTQMQKSIASFLKSLGEEQMQDTKRDQGIRELYDRGERCVRISELLGIGPGIVFRTVARLRLRKRAAKSDREAYEAVVSNPYKTQRQVAELIGMSASGLCKALKRYEAFITSQPVVSSTVAAMKVGKVNHD